MKRALATAAVAGALLTGCGNDVTADVNGATAVTVDAQGNPVVLVAVCHSSIDQVTIAADREGLKEDEENKTLGTWTANKSQKGVVSLDLAVPGDVWTSTSSFVPEASKGYIVIGSQAKADVEATQVYFHGSDLTSLSSDQVIVGDAKVQKRTTFDKTCDGENGSGY